jgi:hypothetical protein
MNTADRAKKNLPTTETVRPTITLQNVMVTVPSTASFSGWGPKVSGVGNVLKNWN